MAGARAAAARRRALWVVTALVLLYAVFEAGRWLAGYSLPARLRERQALESRIAQLAARENRLQAELAAAGVRSQVDREANREAQRMLGELQAEVGRQQQELQFYRGVLAREYGAGTLRVQELAVRPAGGSAFVLEVVLVQAGARDAVVRGELTLTLDGKRAAALASLPLAEVTGGKRRSVPFALRYFQSLEIPVTLPAGFVPTGVTVELRSGVGGPEPERRSFPWRPASGALTP